MRTKRASFLYDARGLRFVMARPLVLRDSSTAMMQSKLAARTAIRDVAETLETPDSARDAIEAAELVLMTAAALCIRQHRVGDGFRCVDAVGRPVRDG